MRNEFAVEPRAKLDAGRQARGETEGEVERGGVVIGTRQAPGVSLPCRAAGRIEKDSVDALQWRLKRIDIEHCAARKLLRACRQVVPRDLRSEWVEFDREHVNACINQCE